MDLDQRYIGQKIILALSGGIDSMVLADLLLKAHADFVVAHCNFHLRGEESDDDERFVRAFAYGHGLPIHVKHFDTTAYALEKGISIEMAARDLRYAWFEELRQALDYDIIMVAHHADDQIETFFINLLRGAGIRGLKGMQETNGHIVRPLLEVFREEVHQYALENHLRWKEDHTNAETLYLRNQIRHQLLPVIDGISKEGRRAILKSIQHLSSENDLYRELLKEKLNQIIDVTPLQNRGSHLGLSSGLPTGLANTTQLLFEWLRDYGFNIDQVRSIQTAMNEGQPGTSFLSATHRLTIEREALELTPICQQNDALLELSYQQIEKDESFTIDPSPQVAQLDYDKLTLPLHIRKWQAGDRFHPIGMKGSRLVSDFLKDLKLTTRQKENVQVLLNADNVILWVVGYRIDDHYKVTENTKTILVVRYE